VKRLNKIFCKKIYKKENVLIIDDSPEKGVDNRGNLITCAPFYGDPSDNELLKVIKLLKKIKDRPDWRFVDKNLQAIELDNDDDTSLSARVAPIKIEQSKNEKDEKDEKEEAEEEVATEAL
jgi:hypothetical protein